MILHRVYRFVMLAAASGVLFQAAASCSTDATNALTSALSGPLGPALTAGLADFLNQIIACPA